MPDLVSAFPYVAEAADLGPLVLAVAGVLAAGFAFAAIRRVGFDV